MVRLTASLTLPLLFLLACSPPPEPITAPLGEEVTVRVGQEVSFNNELQVKFLEVDRDNRCPPDAECAEEGSASISLEVENISDHIIDPRNVGMGVRGSRPFSRGFDVSSEYIGRKQYITGYEYVLGLCPYPDPPGLKMHRQGEYRLYLRVRSVEVPVGQVEWVPITVPCAEK